MRESLERLGIEHQAQVRIGPWTVDFLIRARLVLEVDGDYWHSRPEVIEKDKRKDAWLKANGWPFVHVRESELGPDPVHNIRRLLGSFV